MRNIHRTRKIVIGAIASLILVIAIGIIAACCVRSTASAGDLNDFTWVGGGSYYFTVYHNKTKVMYVVSDVKYNRGTFTLLVDEEGNPLIWEG